MDQNLVKISHFDDLRSCNLPIYAYLKHCFGFTWFFRQNHSDYFTSIAEAGAFASDHLWFRTWGPRPVSRSGHEVESHHRGVTDFEFQTGNSLITLQKWSCEVWSWVTTDCIDTLSKTDKTTSLVCNQLGDFWESRKTVFAPCTYHKCLNQMFKFNHSWPKSDFPFRMWLFNQPHRIAKKALPSVVVFVNERLWCLRKRTIIGPVKKKLKPISVNTYLVR